MRHPLFYRLLPPSLGTILRPTRLVAIGAHGRSRPRTAPAPQRPSSTCWPSATRSWPTGTSPQVMQGCAQAPTQAARCAHTCRVLPAWRQPRALRLGHQATGQRRQLELLRDASAEKGAERGPDNHCSRASERGAQAWRRRGTRTEPWPRHGTIANFSRKKAEQERSWAGSRPSRGVGRGCHRCRHLSASSRSRTRAAAWVSCCLGSASCSPSYRDPPTVPRAGERAAYASIDSLTSPTC